MNPESSICLKILNLSFKSSTELPIQVIFDFSYFFVGFTIDNPDINAMVPIFVSRIFPSHFHICSHMFPNAFSHFFQWFLEGQADDVVTRIVKGGTVLAYGNNINSNNKSTYTGLSIVTLTRKLKDLFEN